MRKVRLILAGLLLAGACVLGTATPAAAVCPQSHGGGCDPCPDTDIPPVYVGDLAVAELNFAIFDNCIQ